MRQAYPDSEIGLGESHYCFCGGVEDLRYARHESLRLYPGKTLPAPRIHHAQSPGNDREGDAGSGAWSEKADLLAQDLLDYWRDWGDVSAYYDPTA
ncbi:MAG: hypothetical protein ACLQUY_14600 [Ktedonobacterales bacterium]